MEENSSNDSSSHMSIFNESINEEENVNNENENENNKVEKEEEKILKFQEKFLAKKRKPLSEEEKKERIERTINRYCKRNDEMIQLLEKINNDETTHKNINRMMRLLAIDLSDTKKLINRKALIFNQKKEIFQRLLNLTFEEYQLFWYKLTDGKLKKGNAQNIKSSNISKAKEIIKSLEEKKNEIKNKNEVEEEEEKKKENSINVNSKNNKTIKEIIQAADLRDIETEKFNEEILGTDNDISDDSLSSSSSDFDEDLDNNSKNIDKEKEDKEKKEKEEKERKEKEEKDRKEKEEKEKKEKEEKEKKEKEEKERKEKEEKERKEKEEKENKEKLLKQTMEEKDEIDIFN